ncbi:MAG TPA: asparaginase [Planctomycetes bacterium]|nr:asparaginase [Planctomycetota bacterium]
MDRRGFLGASLAGSLLGFPLKKLGKAPALVRRRPPVVAVSSRNGLKAVERAYEAMTQGKRPVDAAVHGVAVVEADPRDMSVGYGGLPNADGVVELDSCVMDGPTQLAGAVGALRGIMHPAQVALKVMRRTDHVLLVGEGALRFARMHGFKEENLLTERARKRWLRWREGLSRRDDWVEPGENDLGAPGDPETGKKGKEEVEPRPTGTIHLSALDAKGRLGACTTTSGLAFKIPGRVGDSPLIGCGLYVDNDIGSAGSTGRGEAVILSNGSSSVVEQMRQGKSPTDACLEVLKRIAHFTRIPRLLDAKGRPNFQVNFYAVNKKGEFGAAAFYPAKYAVCTEEGARILDQASLYKRR